MPITQDRMIDLLNAAIAYREAFETLKLSITEQMGRILDGEAAPMEIAGDMLYRRLTLISLDTTHAVTIGIEERHFSKHKRRNDQMRLYMQEQRGSTAPDPQGAHPGDFAPKPKASSAELHRATIDSIKRQREEQGVERTAETPISYPGDISDEEAEALSRELHGEYKAPNEPGSFNWTNPDGVEVATEIEPDPSALTPEKAAKLFKKDKS